MASDPELEDEQRFLDGAHGRLEAMRADANRMLTSVLDLGRGGTFQSRTERDIVVRTSLARLAQLDIGDQALCFGRIDRLPEADGRPGETYHIGRLAVSGEDLEPLVVDWRAPVAEPFYRATGLDPQGLARRRHLAVRGRTVTGLEDEYFTRPLRIGPSDDVPGFDESSSLSAPSSGPGAPGAHLDGPQLVRDGLVLGGPGALLAALGRSRTGRMGDIVATIQREQDEIVRSPLAGVLMVQGAPGTGKTAVALHRAAYLLYTHRFPLERQGVLVLGPNPLFLRYIEQVLPSLGETGVTLSTVSGLVPEIRVRAKDAPEVARLKGEARMARVLARAVRTRQRPLRADLTVPFGPLILRMTEAESAQIVNLARRRPGTHNARRRFVERRVVELLSDQYLQRLAAAGWEIPRSPRTPPATSAGGVAPRREGMTGRGVSWPAGGRGDGGQGGPEEPDEGGVDPAELRRRVRRAPEVAEALDRMWPRLAPHELVHDLLGARPLLAAAGAGILTSEEVASLYRPRSRSLEEVPWSAADAALVDEVRGLLGPRQGRSRRQRPEAADQARAAGRGGVLAGRARRLPVGGTLARPTSRRSVPLATSSSTRCRTLSPLQLRMLARRSLSGSMTVVGDIAQATGPWAPSSWDEIAAHLPDRSPRLVELTVSYRTPAEVVELAAARPRSRRPWPRPTPTGTPLGAPSGGRAGAGRRAGRAGGRGGRGGDRGGGDGAHGGARPAVAGHRAAQWPADTGRPRGRPARGRAASGWRRRWWCCRWTRRTGSNSTRSIVVEPALVAAEDRGRA